MLFFTLKIVNAQTISNTTISNTHFCLGGTYTVSFDTSGTSGSVFTIQLSDITGSFTSPTNLDSSASKSINITIPPSSNLSTNYSLRVVRRAGPAIIGNTLTNLTITKPAPSFTITNNNTCAGSNVSFINTSTGVSPFTCSYSFGATPPAGAPANINNNCTPTVQFNPALGGGTVTYSTTLIVTDGYGCANSISNNVDVKQKPDPRLDTTSIDYDLTKNMFINCSATRNSPDFTLFLSNSSNTYLSNTNYSINWDDGTSNFSNSTFTTTSHLYTTIGLFNILITTTNSIGCSDSKIYQFFNGNTPQGGLLYIGNVNDCIPFTLTWPVDTGGINGTNQNAPGTTYLFHVSDGSPDQSFTQSTLPSTISHTFTKSSCSGSISNAFTINFTRINPCYSNPSSPGTVAASQKPIASFSVLPDTNICINTLTTLTNTSVGNYLNGTSCQTIFEKWWTIKPDTGWTLNTGSLTPTTVSPFLQGSNIITSTFTSAGIFTIKLRINKPNVFSPARCTHDSITKTICVQPLPIPNFTLNQNPTNGCINNLVSITNTSNTLGSCGKTQYKWIVYDSVSLTVYNSGSRFVYVSGTDSTSINPIFNFLQKGKYKIRLQVTNTCGTFTKDNFITIKDKPIVTLKNDIVYCDSQAIAFNPTNVNHNPTYDSSYGTINVYNWNITSNPIGGSFIFLNGNSSSKNPVISFSNTSSAPITYRIIVTATNECGISLPDTQFITINPKPIVTATSLPADTAFCSGDSTNIVLTNNLPSGVTYTWRAFASSLNLSGYSNQTSGVTGPIVQTLINKGSTIETVTYKIAGKQGSTICSGDSTTVIITVYPIPKVIATSQTICSGSPTNLVLSSNVSSTLFTWTASTTGTTTGFSNQITAVTGPIVQTLFNTSNISNDVNYAIKAIANGCNSLDTIIKVAVKPIPQISNAILTQSICSGANAIFSPTSSVVGTTFNYTVSLISGSASGFVNGSGNISQQLFNAGLVPAIVRYSYTPSGGGTPNCIGSSVNFDVTVKPIPSATANPTAAFLCSGAQTNIVLTPNITGTLYTWTAVLTGTATTGFSNNTTPNAGPIAQTITNSSMANSVVTYTITPILNGCVGTPFTSVITVYPGTTPGTVSDSATVCSGINSGTLNLTGNTGNVVNWEYSIAPFLVWNNITNTTTSLIYTNLTQSTRYRAVVQSGTVGSCSQVATNAVLITVDSVTIAGNLTGTDTVCIGTNSGILTLLNKRGSIVNWQLSNTLPTWNNLGTTTVNPYTFNNLTQTTWYRVSVKNGVCPAAFSDSVRIQVDALPSAAIAPNKQICATSLTLGTDDFLVANPISIGTGLWTYLSGPNAPTIVSPSAATSAINNMAIGTHLIQWKVSNGKCAANTANLQFIVYPPLVSTITSNQTICSGQIPSLLIGTANTGGNGSYVFDWQISLNGTTWTSISGANSTNYQPGVLKANTYYRKVVTSGNCIVPSNSILITVLPSISNNTISPNATLCFGNASPIIIGSTPIGGDGIYNYQWQKFNGSTWVNTSTIDILKDYNPGLLSNTIDFRRIVTSSFCNGLQAHTSNTVTITINPLPIVNAGGDSSKCQNQLTYPLYGSPAGGNWTGTGISSNNFNPSAMPLGNYTLIYTFTNANGCVNSDTAIISVIAPPIVNAGNDFSICENATAIQLTGTTPATGGSWSGTAVTSSGIFNPTAAGAGTFKLFYNFTAGSGCGGLDSLLVTVNPKPSPNFIIPPQICPNNSITLATATNVVASITGYNWIVTNNGFLSNTILSSYNTANPLATFPENKTNTDITYNIKLITITNNGCIDSVSNPVLLLKRPLAQFTTGSNINCGPAVYTLTNGTSNVTSSYVWSTNPSAFVNINTSTSIAPKITFPVNTSASAIAYNIQLIATRNDGIASCKDTAIVPITVYPKPIISFNASPKDSGCSPLTVNFNNTSNPQNSENINTMNFLWNFGIYGTDTARNPQRIFTNTGIIDSITNVKVIGTSIWGCKDSIDKIIKVYPFPKADFVSTIYSSCAPFIINNSIVTLAQYPIANSNYLWQILDKSGIVINSSTGTNIPIFNINTPNDTVFYRLITSHTRGCKADTLIRRFITIANPVPNFTLTNSVGCTPLTVNFTNTSTVGVVSTWIMSNGVTPANTNPFNIIFNNLSNTNDTVYTAKLVITAGSGCKDSITKNITVYPKPKAIFNLPNIICADTFKTAINGSIFKAPSVTYGWKFINNTNNSINDSTLATPTFTFINNQTGNDTTNTVRLRVTSVDGCVHDTTKTITILKRPLADFTVPQTLCGPANVLISNPTSLTSTWNWSSIPVLSFTTATSQNPNVLFPINATNDSINYRIQLTATRLGASCVDTTSRLVTIYPKPKANFTTITKDSCGPRLVNFTNMSDAKNGESLNSMSYLWTNLNKNITTKNTSETFTNTGVIDSIYNTRLIATSKHGCKDTLIDNVTVRPNAKASFNYIISTSCAPFVITNLNVVTNVYSNTNLNYYWYANNIPIGFSSTFPGYTIANANDSVLIKLVTTSLRGCKDDSMEVWFKTIPNPVPNFTMNDSAGCSPLSINFNNTSTFGVISVWTISNGVKPTNTNPFNVVFNNISNTNDATYTAKLVITAGTGCKDSITKTITVYPKPKAIFSLPSIICADTFKTANNTSVYKAPSATYGWQFITNSNNSINDTTLLTPIFTFINNQTGIDSSYTIRLRATSLDGCVHDTTQNITIYKRPLAVFSVPITTCGLANVFLSNSTSLNSSWSWSSNPPLSFNTATSQNPVVFFPLNTSNDSINYKIKLTATRLGSTCLDTTNRLITVYPKPKAAFTSLTQDSCGPRLVKFTNTSDAKNGESLSSMSYLWTYLNNNISSINATGSYTNIGVIDSTYNTRLIATSMHGCKDTFNSFVTVKPNAKASFNLSSATSCAPFILNSSNIVTNLYTNANSTYKWYANNNLIGITSTFPSYTIATANDSVLIKLVTTSLRGCKDDSMEVWFKTIPNPVPNFTMNDSTGCTPLSINFNNTSTTGVISDWTISSGATPANNNSFGLVFNNYSNTIDVSYTAKLIITAGTGCKDSITKTIKVYPKPKAIFTLQTNACALSSLNPNNNSTSKIGNVKYVWSIIEPTATTIDDSTLANPLFSFGDNQLIFDSLFNFTLLVTSVDGCIDRDTQNIRIFKRPLALFTVPPTFCGVSNVNILNSTALNSNWSWNSTPIIGFNSSTIKNPTVTFPINNTNDSINYNIKLIATRNGTICVDSTNRLVTIYPQPKADFLTTRKDSCGPRLVNFTNISTAKNGEPFNTLSFLWTYLNNNVFTTNIAATYSNTGVVDSTYFTRLITTSKHGCKDTLIDSVIVRPNAKASFSYTINLSCAPFNLTASNIQAANHPSANSSYQWYANNVLIGNGVTFPGYTISNQNDSVLIKLVTNSKNGCKNDSIQAWFRTIPNPKPNYTAIDSIGCTPLIVNFNNTSNPISGVGFRWEFGNNSNISAQTNPNFTFYNYGITDTIVYTKLVITANGTGCSDSITRPIIIKPLPRPDLFLSDSVLCYPNLLNVTNLSPNIPIYDITSFKWKVIGPDAVSILNDTANSSTNISFPDNKTGANKFYQIWLKIRSTYGCIDSVKKTIRILTRPISSFNFSADSSCAPVIISTNNTTQYANTFSWTSADPNVIINNPNMINTSIKFPSHKGTIDFIYPIKLVSQTISGCFDTIIKPFKVFPLPISKFTLDKDSGCSPLSVIFYNSTTVKTPASYFWNFGDGNTQINNADTFTKTFIGSIYQDTTYIIQLISTSANGCKDTTFKTIKVKASAFAKIKLNDTLICSNAVNPTKLTILNKSFGSVDTFYWDFGDGTQLISTIDSTIHHPYPIEGTYTIILKATNSCRTSYDTSKITVQTPPTVNFSKSDSIGCSPLAVTFSNLSTNIYKAKFLWSFGNGATSNLITPPTVNYLQSRTQDTTYYMSLKVSNFCGVYQKNDSIKVLPKPIAIFLTSADSGCSPLPVYMINHSVGLPINYKWYFGNGDSSLRFAPLQTPITYRTIDTISYFKIKLIATNTCGIDSIEKTIKVFPNTVKSFFTTSGNAGCEGLMVNFYDNSTGGNSISWNFGDGITSLLKNPTHQYNKPGTFYAYQYVNNGCSFDTSFVIISVLPNPQFTISKSAPNICIKNPVQFNANLKDSGVITWYFGDGDTSNAFNPIHNYNSAGKKFITVMLKSFYNSCISIKYDTINVLPIPVITLTADTNQACAYHLFKLNASSPQTNIFNWDFGDNNTGAGSSLTHLYQFGGTYTVKILAQTSFGCIDSTTKQLVVFPVPTSAFSYTPKDTCNGPVTVKFTNLSVGANNFLWNFGNGNNSTNVNPTAIYSNVGSYPIQLISSNQFSCYDTSKSEYFVYQTPKAALDFTPESGCPPLQVTFINKSQFGTSYLWEFGDGETDTSFSPNHTYLISGKYKVKLTVKAGTVCFDSINSLKEVTVFAKPVPIFTSQLLTDKKPYRTVVFNSKTDSVKTYEWYFKGKLIGRGSNPTFTFDDGDSGVFIMTLKITSIDGCDSSYSQTFEMPGYWNGLYIPNAFTPELDNAASKFKPAGLELKEYTIKVYTKWGKLVWQSSELLNGVPVGEWYGLDIEGNPCIQGSYVWIVEKAIFTDGKPWKGQMSSNNIHQSSGNVTLIR